MVQVRLAQLVWVEAERAHNLRLEGGGLQRGLGQRLLQLLLQLSAVQCITALQVKYVGPGAGRAGRLQGLRLLQRGVECLPGHDSEWYGGVAGAHLAGDSVRGRGRGRGGQGRLAGRDGERAASAETRSHRHRLCTSSVACSAVQQSAAGLTELPGAHGLGFALQGRQAVLQRGPVTSLAMGRLFLSPQDLI